MRGKGERRRGEERRIGEEDRECKKRAGQSLRPSPLLFSLLSSPLLVSYLFLSSSHLFLIISLSHLSSFLSSPSPQTILSSSPTPLSSPTTTLPTPTVSFSPTTTLPTTPPVLFSPTLSSPHQLWETWTNVLYARDLLPLSHLCAFDFLVLLVQSGHLSLPDQLNVLRREFARVPLLSSPLFSSTLLRTLLSSPLF